MTDCEWITSQVGMDEVRRRFEKRRVLRARVASLVPFRRHALPALGRSHRGPGDPNVGSRA